ncbi:MAG: DUF2938 family protein [Betaproteobacteria bacterium]|nr:DUF2938 family protein [Betaproteobacteria bacterium]MCC7218940.1 DUF2938 family protein [Burkholderiales bacterium]
MKAMLRSLMPAVPIGAGATAVTDVRAAARSRHFAIPLPDCGLGGRWFAYMARGQFRHEHIAVAPLVRSERRAAGLRQRACDGPAVRRRHPGTPRAQSSCACAARDGFACPRRRRQTMRA